MADNQQRDPWSDPAFELAVRETAYFLWEQDGKPRGFLFRPPETRVLGGLFNLANSMPDAPMG